MPKPSMIFCQVSSVYLWLFTLNVQSVPHVAAVLMAGEDWATHFNHLFQPVSGETRLDLEGKFSGSAETFRHTGTYIICMSELREDIGPELELIRTRVVAPIKEFQSVLKTIRKCMTKREHKVNE